MADYVVDYQASIDPDAEFYNIFIDENIYGVPDHLAGPALEKFILQRLRESAPGQYYRNLKIR